MSAGAAKAEAAVVTFRRGRRVTGCVVDAQTCFTTSEAGKRTFFWDAYLSSSAR